MPTRLLGEESARVSKLKVHQRAVEVPGLLEWNWSVHVFQPSGLLK